MNNDEFVGNIASSETNTMDTEFNFERELYEMEQKINHYKLKLQKCRDKYERAELEIHDVRRLQRNALFMLKSAQMEEEDLHKRLENLHLNYETCVKKSNNYEEDLDETIYAKINELTTQRNMLMEELAQMKKNADDNRKKLAQINEMITEQEGKNISVFQELEKRSKELTSIPQDIKEQINTVLKRLKISEKKNR